MSDIFRNLPPKLKERALRLLETDDFARFGQLKIEQEENPSIKLRVECAHEFLRKREYGIAKRVFSDMLTDYPYLINAHAGLGASHFYLSDIKQSLKEYQKAISILIEYELHQIEGKTPGNPIWHTSIPVKGLRIFKDKVFIGDARLSAFEHIEDNELPDEDEEYSNVVQPEALYHFGNYCREKHLYPEAIASFCLAVKLKPDFSLAQTNLGTVLAESGSMYEAKIELAKALALDVTDAVAQSGMGTVFLHLEDFDSAKKHLKEALRLRNGVYPFAKEQLAYAYSGKKPMKKTAKQKDIFLSYASEDKNFADRLANDLDDYGLSVWIDEWFILPGDSITEKINSALKDCRYFVPILSNSFLTKHWPQRELSSAIMRQSNAGQKYIIPLLIEKCSLPDLLLDIAYSDFTKDYDSSLTRLKLAVST